MQDDDSPISAASFQPVDKSYQLLANVSTLAQGGHISAWANVETCGSVASPVVHFGEKRCGEGTSNRRAARRSTPSRRRAPPSSKRRGVLRHNNQPEQKGKGGRTGEPFCLFYSTAPPTNTSSIYFISLKGGRGSGAAVVSSASNDARRPWAWPPRRARCASFSRRGRGRPWTRSAMDEAGRGRERLGGVEAVDEAGRWHGRLGAGVDTGRGRGRPWAWTAGWGRVH